MRTKSEELQYQINEIDRKIQEGVNLSARNQLEAQRNDLNDQLQVALAEEAHEGRIQEATAESENILDDIEIAGVPIAESGLSELAYTILKAKVQAKYVAKVESLLQEMSEQRSLYQLDLKVISSRAETIEATTEQLQTQNKDLEVANYQLGLDNDALKEKVAKSAELLNEATETIEAQKVELETLRNTVLLGANTAPKVIQSTSEQIRLQEEALKASRIRVTSMIADPEDFSKRKWTVTLALTGEEVVINYLEKGNYTVISEEEAEQLRNDEANKKAEIEAQIAVIPVQEPESIEYVTEQEEVAEPTPFTEANQVDTAELGLVDSTSSSHGESVKEESEVITLESLHERVKALEDRLSPTNGIEQAVA